MPARMSLKQWEAILPEDKEVLKAMGLLSLVKPKKPSKGKSTKNTLQPYVLKRLSFCSICSTTSISYFKMVTPPGKPFLISIKIKEKDILPTDIIKNERDFLSGCSYCYKILMNKSKEELIRKLIIAKKGR